MHHARTTPLLERAAHALHGIRAQPPNNFGHHGGGPGVIKGEGSAQPRRGRAQVVGGDARVRDYDV
jgi:hypothetical protein